MTISADHRPSVLVAGAGRGIGLSRRAPKLIGDPQKVMKADNRSRTARHLKRRYRCDNLSRHSYQ